jgi:hypothetical protein
VTQDKENTVTLTLQRFDVGQMLDGLRVRRDSWFKTAAVLADDDSDFDDEPIEECSDADEARNIGEHYERIIGAIERQL